MPHPAQVLHTFFAPTAAVPEVPALLEAVTTSTAEAVHEQGVRYLREVLDNHVVLRLTVLASLFALM